MKTLLTTTALVALLSAAPALAQSDTAPDDHGAARGNPGNGTGCRHDGRAASRDRTDGA